MALGRGAANLKDIIARLSSGEAVDERNKATVDDGVIAGVQAGPVNDPLPPKKPQHDTTIANNGNGSLTGDDDIQSSTSQSKRSQETVGQEEVPSNKKQEAVHSPSLVQSQQRTTKKDTAHIPGEASRPKAAPPSISLSQPGRSANNGGNNGNDGDAVSPSSPSSPRRLGPRSWIVRCTEINDLVSADLSRLCALKGQVRELLSLSSQLVPSTRPWRKLVSTAPAEAGEYDFEYNERLQRLAAEPDVLVDELRILQRALGTTLPATRRVSVSFDLDSAVAKATNAAGMSENGNGNSSSATTTSTSTSTRSSTSAGTYEELEGLRTRWAALSKRVIALSSHLDKIVKAAAEACRKSGAHPERPALVARVKQLVAEAQPGTIYKPYEEVGLSQVVGEVYPQGRPEPEITSDDSLWEQQQKKNATALIVAAVAEALRAVPMPQSVSGTTEKVVKDGWTVFRSIPGVHGMGYGHAPFFASWRGAIKFMLRPRYYLLKGYQKHKSGYFKIATLRDEYILVSDKAKISEVSDIKQLARPLFVQTHMLTLSTKLLAAPADVLSFLDISADEIQSKWTLGNTSPWHLGLISGKLTQNLGTLTPGLVKEINVALDKYIGSPRDFSPIALHNVMHKVVAQTVSYALVGHPLCRDEVYLGNVRAFTRAVHISAELIRPFPDSLKSYLIRLTPAWRRRKFAEEVMHSAVLARLRKTYKAKEAKPVDLLQWLAETAPSRERNVTTTVERIMGMNLAAMQGTSSILTGAVVQLALAPDLYTPTLRQEILTHRENGITTHKTLLNATKLDSFVREASRMNPTSMIGLMRVARKEFRFRDGTSVPKGTRMGVPTVAIHQDATFYPKPDFFDGFRFSKLLEEHPNDNSKYGAASTGLDYLTFGHGKHVWYVYKSPSFQPRLSVIVKYPEAMVVSGLFHPVTNEFLGSPGRFFATDLMKLVLPVLIMRYDIKLPPKAKPHKRYFGMHEIPDSNLRVLVKATGNR
ncbi:hypothetical protein PG997_012654 [Apiospora hydei]|uniref:Uncharacterized protein n=1 Tax=Apiospora hydei TaxID=1337664 RepID=A0ABR1V411_9PEZI